MLGFDRHDGGGDATLVLLHSLALDRSAWDGFLPHVPDRFDVLTVDLPNHGISTRIPDLTIPKMGDAVATFIREQGVGPAVVIGMSLGGCVAQAVAAQHGELVRGLGLLDTTAWYGPTAPADWEGRAQKAVNNGMESLSGFQLDRWFSPDFNAEHPQVGERLLEVFRSNDIDAYVATCRAMGAADLRDEIGSITAPTTVIVGADDKATPPSHAEEIRQRIPGAGLHVLPDLSHLSAIERPDLIADILALDLFPRI